MNRLGTAVLAIVSGTLLVACGYGAQSNVREMTEDDLFGLDQTTTTSTTTTTTTTIPSSAPNGPGTTSTTLAVVTEPVSLYFLDGQGLFAVQRGLTQHPSLQRVLDALEEGPQQAGSAGVGLRSAILDGLIGPVTQAGGVVTVELVPEVYERIDASNELAVVAQIVLTLTDRPGVGQVRFTRGGELIRVRLGNNQVSALGEAVAKDDYLVLLANIPDVGTIPPATSTTTAATDAATDGTRTEPATSQPAATSTT